MKRRISIISILCVASLMLSACAVEIPRGPFGGVSLKNEDEEQDGDTFAVEGASREELIAAHVANPSMELCQRISEIPVEVTDEVAVSYLSAIIPFLREGDMETVRDQIETDVWQQLYQDGYVGMTRHSIVAVDGQQVDVYSDEFETRIRVQESEGDIVFSRIEGDGAMIYAGGSDGSRADGAFELIIYDQEGRTAALYDGTLESGHCVGMLGIQADQSMYSGQFDDQGHVMEQQIASVTAAGQTIYAYDKDRITYLFGEGAPEEFLCDLEFLGLQGVF